MRLVDRLDLQEPRTIEKEYSATWYLFTDASFEPSDENRPVAELGALLYDASSIPLSHVTKMLSCEQIMQVQSVDRKTSIFELEVLALVLALVLWTEILAG